MGKAGLPGVVAVYGRSRSRWFDVHRRGHPGVVVSPPHPRVAGVGFVLRVCGGVSSHIGCSAPPVPPVGMVPLHCR